MQGSRFGLATALAILWACGARAAGPPQPSPQLRSLEAALTGAWSVSDSFAPIGANADSINTPMGGTGHGIQVWRSSPGGFTFMEEERQETPAGQVFIVGYTWWDATAGKLRGMECNSQWPKGCDALASQAEVELSWDGRSFVVDFRDPKNPTRIVWHEVFTDITPTTFVQTADIGQTDGSLKRWMTIHAKRIK